MVTRGYYRHYKGHLYTVIGVGCAKHENDRRMVVYTSVKTEEGNEGFDYLLREEREFEEMVDESTGETPTATAVTVLPRFERIVDPEFSKVPRKA